MPTEARTVASMSRWNSGLSAWTSALVSSIESWPDTFFDVVHDEGEPLAVLAQLLRLRQDLRRPLLGDPAGHLASDDA